MNRFLLSALAATTFLAGGIAVAQMPRPSTPPSQPPGHDFLGALDTNKDGIITRAEFTADLEKRFATLDIDKNGVISVAERKSARDARQRERLDARFTALDSDKNNQISREEFLAAHDRRGPPEGAAPGPDGPPPPPDGERGFGGGRHGGDHGPGGFGMKDGRGPGFGPRPRGDEQAEVTKEQFMARPLRLFDILDSNDDGKITATERQAAQDRHGRFGGPDRQDAPGN
ncbi:MAG: EF-hand domain-containing protein [Sphingobium sp.]